MGLVTLFGRIIIVVLNVIFFIVSFVMTVTGFLLKFMSDNAYVKSAEDNMKASIKSSMSTTGLGDQNAVDNIDLTSALSSVAIILIVLGILLMSVSFFGMIGGCCKVRLMLVIYGGLVAVLLLVQVICAILFLATDVGKDQIKDAMKKSLSKYKGLKGTNMESLVWNGVMTEFKCCGAENFHDFKTHATEWEYSSVTLSNTNTVTLDMPYACCKSISSSNIDTCMKSTSSDNYKNDGCLQKIWERSLGNPVRTTLVLLTAFGFQLLLIVFSILLFREVSKVGHRV